jgi:hypothetical protein
MLLRALLLAGLLVVLLLYAQRSGQGVAGCLALFGQN